MSNDEFYQELVPFFEEKCTKLLDFLKNDKSWRDVLLPYKLIFVNNKEIEDDSHLGVSDELPNHIYLLNQKSPSYKFGYSSKVIFNESLTYTSIKACKKPFDITGIRMPTETA